MPNKYNFLHCIAISSYCSGASIGKADRRKAEDAVLKDQVEASKLRRIRANVNDNRARFLAGNANGRDEPYFIWDIE